MAATIMVLIIEDEHAIADLIKDRLCDDGCQVRIAYTGADALQKLKERKPDVITLDMNLPDIDGLMILRDIKSDPETYRIPVVIISSSDEVQGAKNMGADDVVPKPINFRKLFNIIHAVQDGRKCA